MAISLRSSGASTTVTTNSISPAYPGTIVAGDLLVVGVAGKYNNIDLPNSLWFQTNRWTVSSTSQGSGTGIDSGAIFVTVFVKIADGTETGTQTFNFSSPNNVGIGQMHCFQKDNSYVWEAYCYNWGGNHTTTSYTQGLGVGESNMWSPNDLIEVVMGFNNDTIASCSGQSLTGTSITFGSLTERLDTVTASGQDMGMNWWSQPMSSGSTVAGATTLTLAFSTAGSAASGVVSAVTIRLREAPIVHPLGCSGGFFGN